MSVIFIAATVNFLLKRKTYWISERQDGAILFSCTRFNQTQHLALRLEGQPERRDRREMDKEKCKKTLEVIRLLVVNVFLCEKKPT